MTEPVRDVCERPPAEWTDADPEKERIELGAVMPDKPESARTCPIRGGVLGNPAAEL